MGKGMVKISEYIIEKLHIDKSTNSKLDDKRVPVPFDTIYEWFYDLIDEYFKIIKKNIHKCEIDEIADTETYDTFKIKIYTSSINTFNNDNIHMIAAYLRNKLNKKTSRKIEYGIYVDSVVNYITFYIYK